MRKHISENLVYIATLVSQFFHMTGYCKCSNKAPTPIYICTGFEEAVLRPKIFGNRLGILTYQ